MALLDFLGRRGTLRLGWELRGGPLPFRELQRRADISSPNLLAARLREALDLGIVQRDESGGYGLTPSGAELNALLAPLDLWAKRWAVQLRSRSARTPASRRRSTGRR
jgi:DNA-binding HxlR family transcriptional regulator